MAQRPANLLRQALLEFEQITTFKPHPTPEYMSALVDLCNFLQDKPLRPKRQRRRRLLAHINRKFRLNQPRLAAIYAASAKRGVTFNYHEKEAIQQALDLSDRSAFLQVLANKGSTSLLTRALTPLFRPLDHEATIAAFQREVAQPSHLRRKRGHRQIDREILLATLSSFLFSHAEAEVLHSYFDHDYDPQRYQKSFWLQLRTNQPELYNRDRTLEVVHIHPNFSRRFADYPALQSALMDLVSRSYSCLSNHGYLAVWIDPIRVNGQAVTWDLVESLKLFAEKFLQVPLTTGYFAHPRISTETASYIPTLDPAKAQFHLAAEGFDYRDCFVLSPSHGSPFGAASLLLLFQKNQRDETPIPCPACRTHDVQGNSYPALGVRSWECRNLLCPDRSKYNRGKRYSFKSLLMQEAIARPENTVPHDLVKAWSRDVQYARKPDEVLEMLVRFYSLSGDSIRLLGFPPREGSLLYGRKACWGDIPCSGRTNRWDSFSTSPWFRRYVLDHQDTIPFNPGIGSVELGPFKLVHGDARTALASFPDSYFDGAVTSPPYYNAREYAQWPNIYCYLYDMFGVIKECHRVLKPGAFFLFNIFDNFDNEKSIVFSAMGNRKLVLSSMLSDLFQRTGFRLCGSVVWDKGEIEGKRAYNGGNLSPYYQSPFNCWEHILVLAKVDENERGYEKTLSRLPTILRAQPVVKMVRGENLHGHTAPFPPEVPALLSRLTAPGSILLDPFGGSATTARGLCDKEMHVVCIERDQDYCALAERMFREFRSQGEQLDLLSFYGEGLNLEVDSTT